MRADAPSFTPSQTPPSAAAGAGAEGTDKSGGRSHSQNGSNNRRGKGKQGHKKNGSRKKWGGGYPPSTAGNASAIASAKAFTITDNNNDAAATDHKATTNARDRRRMRRRPASADAESKRSCATSAPFPTGTIKMTVAARGANTDLTRSSKGASSSNDTKGGDGIDKLQNHNNRRAKENQKGRQSGRRREQSKKRVGRIKKGSQRSSRGGSNVEIRQLADDLGADFPSLGGAGTVRDAGVAQGSATSKSKWSQVAAPRKKAEENEGEEDELLSEIKAKDLTRLSSALSAQSSCQRRTKRTGEYSAWSDAEDGGVGTNTGSLDIISGTQANASEEQDVSGGMDNSRSISIQRSRGLNIRRMRERWWAALREKKEKDSKRRAEAARIESMTRDYASSDDDSSSSCSSLSSWGSSSFASDLSGPNPDGVRGGTRKQCFAPVAHVEVDVSQYMKNAFPLHLAVIKDDLQAVTHLLTLSPTETKRDDFVSVDIITNEFHVRSQADDKPARLSSFSLVHLSTFLDMPHMLRLFLDASIVSPALAVDSKDSNGVTPLMIACQDGLEGCVRVLLGYGPRMAMKEHLLGEGVLHICSRCNGTQPSMLRLLLSSSGKGSNQQRILCARNKKGQTAMHVACEQGQTSLVETFLAEAPIASTKALKVEDLDGRRPLLAAVASGNTDLVISLLMWRGNNMKLGQGKFSSGRKPSSGKHTPEKYSTAARNGLQSCPLKEAVSTGNCDMVRLLLEFGGPSVSASAITYDFNGALLVALALPPSGKRCDIVDILINAGADPYSCCDSASRNTADSSSLSHLSALTVAAYNGDVEALNDMLNVSSYVLETKREGRRNDPLIQKHYEVLESRERGAVEISIQESLVRALYWGWMGSQNGSDHSNCLRCCLSLYRNGAKLSDSNFFRLQRSLADDKLSAKNGDVVVASDVANHDICFEAHYSHPVRLDRVGKIDKGYWCKQLVQLEWFRKDAKNATSSAYCPWIQEALEMHSSSSDVDGVIGDDFVGDLCILCVGSEKLHVHPRILCRKSDKFEAAVRFAALQNNESDEDGPIELAIDAPLHLLKLFLQHCYTGSILIGLPPEPQCLVETLLELALLADEYLCPSLLQECELRLLSPVALDRCFCVNCCNATSPRSDRAENFDDRESMINCLCRVQGKGGLISTECAADIIAVGRDEGIANAGYQVRAFLPTNKHSECLSLQPFAAASFNAARGLLQDFRSPYSDEGLSLVMLEICLDAASTRSAKEVSSLVFTGAGTIDSTKSSSHMARKSEDK